jgi:uncharacterized protein (TIRG00374 family)
MKNRWSFILRLLVGVGILFILFRLVPYQEFTDRIRTADTGMIAASFAVLFSMYLVSALRWYLVLKGYGLDVPYANTFLLIMTGFFFNLFVPSVIAADVFRTSMLVVREKSGGVRATSSVILDRIAGFMGLFVLACLALIFAPRVAYEPEVLMTLALMGLVLAVLFMLMLSRRISRFLLRSLERFTRVHRTLSEFTVELGFFRRHPRVLLNTVLLSVVIHFGTVISFYLSAKAFGAPDVFGPFTAVMPVILALSVMPVTIAGLGTRELGSVYFLGKIGISQSIALGTSLMNLLFLIVAGLIGGVLYVSFSDRWLQRPPSGSGRGR